MNRLFSVDLTGTGDSAMSRRKSFKKSLRESFRRLRKRRSERRRKAEEKTGEQQSEQKRQVLLTLSWHVQKTLIGPLIFWSRCLWKWHTFALNCSGDPAENAPPADGATGETSTQPASEATTPGDAVRSIERAIEARTAADDGLTSMVRFLYFADTFLNNGEIANFIQCNFIYLHTSDSEKSADHIGRWTWSEVKCGRPNLFRSVPPLEPIIEFPVRGPYLFYWIALLWLGQIRRTGTFQNHWHTYKNCMCKKLTSHCFLDIIL